MREVTGDLIHMAKTGQFDVIIHGCNCFCTMGSGIAAQIKNEFPSVYEADKSTKKGDRGKMGWYTYAGVNMSNGVTFTIINAYTQYRYGHKACHVDYDAVSAVFNRLSKLIPDHARIGYPMIGAGLGGGNWDLISSIIDREFITKNHTLVRYDQ